MINKTIWKGGTAGTPAKEILRRYILLVTSLLIMAIGIVITKKSELGVSPISSVPNVISMWQTTLSLGNLVIIWNCVLIAGQIVLLRSKFQLIQLLQLPLSLLFGYFTDFAMWVFTPLQGATYTQRIMLVLLGTVILGIGVCGTVIANVIMNSGEAFVKAVSDTIHVEFGNVKVRFDVTCVVLSLIISWILFEGDIVGTREGTLIAALCTGWIVKILKPLLEKPLGRLMMKD